MYFAYKYAKKRHAERQQRKAAYQLPGSEERESSAQDAAGLDNTAGLAAAADDQAVGSSSESSAAPPATTNAGKSEAKPEETAEERAEKKRRRRYRLRIILGLTAPFTLQALDTTIIASALKFIAVDFNQLAQINWIITAFNLTSAAFLPMFAQLADVLGRHATLQMAVAAITLGSALCAASPTSAFGVLLLGQALQGVGAAGINMCVRTILADRVSLADYAKNWTLFSVVSAVAFSVGPVVGGYLTQVSWRWCFAVNLPVGVAAIALALLLLRGHLVGPQEIVVRDADGAEHPVGEASTGFGRFVARMGTIDYGGQLLFLWGFGLLVLAFTWAGGTYPWGSAAVIATLVVGGVLAVAWLVYEWAMVPGRAMARAFPTQKAMMPWQLLTQRDMGLLFFISFAGGAAMFAVMYFMELYFTLVQGRDASTAGVSLLCFLPGLGAGAYSSMFLVNVFPWQTLPTLLLGTVCSSTGITVLAFACQAENNNLIYGMMALTGYGVGVNFNPGSLHGLAYFPGMTASITCPISFANPFGGTICLTIMMTVFNNRSGPNHADPKTGIVWAFTSMIPIMWLQVLGATFLGNVWIRKDGRHDVVHGAWIWSRLRGKKLEKETMSRRDEPGSVEGTSGVRMKSLVANEPGSTGEIELGR